MIPADRFKMCVCVLQNGVRAEQHVWSYRMRTSPLKSKMTGKDLTRLCTIRSSSLSDSNTVSITLSE